MIIQCEGADMSDFYMLMANGGIDVLDRETITISYILAAVCRFYGVDKDNVLKKCQDEDVVRPRQIVHYYARLLTKKGFKAIGAEVGEKDHATVMHSCKVISNFIETDKEFRELVIKPINHLLSIY